MAVTSPTLVGNNWKELDEKDQKLVIDPAEVKRLLRPEEIRAKYKIEVHFGKDRTSRTACTCAVLIWESGKQFHGGGDEKMYWCGYKDCSKPISADLFAAYHVQCPTCQRESILDHQSRNVLVADLEQRGEPLNGIDKIPIVVGEKIIKLPPRRIAEFLAKVWYDLKGDADIYLKYHRNDIRFQIAPGQETFHIEDKLMHVRGSRGLMIYPLKNILKDVSAGADLTNRFLAMITA